MITLLDAIYLVSKTPEARVLTRFIVVGNMLETNNIHFQNQKKMMQMELDFIVIFRNLLKTPDGQSFFLTILFHSNVITVSRSFFNLRKVSFCHTLEKFS